MRTFICLAIIAAVSAVDIKTLEKAQVKTEAKASSRDGPTNGVMADDERDTLIQVLCPGPIVTSYSLAQGKSSTCNAGSAPKATLVQESETVGQTEIA